MAQKLPVSITKEEFMLLLEEAIRQREHFRKKRSGKLKPRGIWINRYIIAMILGFGAGMRISEILGFEQRHYEQIMKQYHEVYEPIKIAQQEEKKKRRLELIKQYHAKNISKA